MPLDYGCSYLREFIVGGGVSCGGGQQSDPGIRIPFHLFSPLNSIVLPLTRTELGVFLLQRSSSQSLGGGILSRRHPPARVNPPNEDNVAPVIVIASYQVGFFPRTYLFQCF
jgi:hypothetical protein